MIEYNNSIFYKVKFDITALKENDDLIWSIVLHLKRWLTRKFNKTDCMLSDVISGWSRLRNGGVLYSSDKKTVFIETECFRESENMDYWACKITEKQPQRAGYAPREWVTEVGIKPVQKNQIEFSCVISYLDSPGFIGICEDEPTPNVPNLIKRILGDKNLFCSFGCDQVSILPNMVHPGEWLTFWNNLQRSERRLPYIFISVKDPENSDDEPSYLIDPQKLATAAGGNALVFAAADGGTIEEMDYCCPQEYKCYKGALRIYKPGINLQSPEDSLHHRYITANTILELGEEKVIQMIRRALAQDVHFYESFFRVKDCSLKKAEYARQYRLEQLKKEHEEKNLQATKTAEEWCSLALSEEEQRLKAEDSLEQVNAELRDVKEENYRLSSEVQAYRSLAAKNAELERACNNRLNAKFYPKTPQDIVQYFDATFGDRIAFSEDVDKSIKDCSISSEELWECLFALATTMRELYIAGSKDFVDEFYHKTTITIGRGQGATTHQNKQFMKQYITLYHGMEIDIEAHVKCKNYQRIYFGYCEEEQKVIVGWCGEHKDNATTHKVK